ncbi:MAG: flavin reductase family protein [Candidatus Tectomicrobia bacterium]|uniref:Flavin reductase family protein n=1 Tax=Tectimicrobiota bacterium TaxID=2528274 RepID=A0A932G1R6_UNCTE|nr:flavin reductase family protein [Candidatus Tectomicrobia bacterium]
MKKSVGAKTVVYPTPVFIVGTYDNAGRPNAMAAAWGGICCSKPPCVTVSLRKATYTYGSMMEQKCFTVSIPSQDYVKEADYFGIFSGRDEDKFSATGLTPVRSELINAPYVKEFPFALECKLIHTYEIGLHTQFIGEILDIKADETILTEDGLPDIEKVRPILYAPENRKYYGVGELLGKAFSIGKTR